MSDLCKKHSRSRRKRSAGAGGIMLLTSRPIGEISESLGYCDPFYFSGEFRRITGKSPGAARKRKALI